MILENAIKLPLPADEVFDLLLDTDTLVSCLPQARLLRTIDETTIVGEITVPLRITTVTFRGRVRIVLADRSAGAMCFSAVGQELRDHGTAKGHVELRLRESAGTTVVSMNGSLQLLGGLRAIARDITPDVGKEIVQAFAAALARRIVAVPTPAHIESRTRSLVAQPVAIGRATAASAIAATSSSIPLAGLNSTHRFPGNILSSRSEVHLVGQTTAHADEPLHSDMPPTSDPSTLPSRPNTRKCGVFPLWGHFTLCVGFVALAALALSVCTRHARQRHPWLLSDWQRRHTIINVPWWSRMRRKNVEEQHFIG